VGTVVVDHPADGVARVTIDNAAKRNALDAEILEGLASTLPELDARCVILTGAGDAFSAGYDIGNLTPERLADVLIHPFEAAMAAVDAVPVPVVAALGGHAFGGGLELALACDLRVCAAGAKLGMPPARLGVVYSHTGLRRFVDAIGSTRTRELFFTARPVSADEALSWGLVNEVVEDVAARSVDLGRSMAELAPLSLRGNKRVLQALIPPLDPALHAELEALRREAFASDDFAEGVRSFMEKRPPRWHGK
jgi:enoyl-CoA hydratase/carnithine racemase